MEAFYPDLTITRHLSILRCRPHVLALPFPSRSSSIIAQNLSWPPSIFGSPFVGSPFIDIVESLVDIWSVRSPLTTIGYLTTFAELFFAAASPLLIVVDPLAA
jgi:hypothetical protein